MINEDLIKLSGSIIEYRTKNLKRVMVLLNNDMKKLYSTKNKHSRNMICDDIYTKLEFMEILLSKNIDDVVSLELMAQDDIVHKTDHDSTQPMIYHEENHYIQ